MLLNTVGIQDFFEADTAILTLEIDPATGNVCYLTLNRGEVRCFRYQVSNVPPTVSINANPLAGPSMYDDSFLFTF